MRRREVIAGLGSAVLAVSSRTVPAQTNTKVPVVGVAALATRESHVLDLEGFREAARPRIPRRTDRPHRGALCRRRRYWFPDLVADLVRSRTDVFVTPGPRAAQLVQSGAPDARIVAVALPATYPLLFESLARPGGRVTGFSHMGTDLAAKRIELLGEALPEFHSVAVLYRVADSGVQPGPLTRPRPRAAAVWRQNSSG